MHSLPIDLCIFISCTLYRGTRVVVFSNILLFFFFFLRLYVCVRFCEWTPSRRLSWWWWWWCEIFLCRLFFVVVHWRCQFKPIKFSANNGRLKKQRCLHFCVDTPRECGMGRSLDTKQTKMSVCLFILFFFFYLSRKDDFFWMWVSGHLGRWIQIWPHSFIGSGGFHSQEICYVITFSSLFARVSLELPRSKINFNYRTQHKNGWAGCLIVTI